MNAPALHVDVDPAADRPRTWGQCLAAGLGTPELPCPYVGCKFNLYLDVCRPTGAVTLAHPELEPEQLAETCALRVASRGEHTLAEIGALLGVTRERVRQLEVKATRRLLRGAARRRAAFDLDLGGRARAPRAGAPSASRRNTGLATQDEVKRGLARVLATLVTPPVRRIAPSDYVRPHAGAAGPSPARQRAQLAVLNHEFEARVRAAGGAAPAGRPAPAPEEPPVPATKTKNPAPRPARAPRPQEPSPPPRAPDADGVTVVETITPELALKYLETNRDNRPVSEHLVDKYAADMRRGAWELTHEGLAFDVTGRLIDGQHRLFAIDRAGVAVRMRVTRGLDPAARGCIDGGKPRSVADQLRFVDGVENSRGVTSIVRVWAMVAAGRPTGVSRAHVNAERARCGAAIAWALKHGPRKRPLKRAAIVAALAHAHHALPEVTEAFTAQLLEPAGHVAGTPVLALRTYITERLPVTHENERVVFTKVLRCVLGASRGESFKQIVAGDEVLDEFARLHAARDGAA